jgi:EpsI family protein
MTSSTMTRSLVVAGCLLAAAGYLAKASRAEAVPQREPLAAMPFQIDGWKGRREPDFTPEILAVLGVDDYIVRTYFQDRVAVSLYVGYHDSQRQGDTIHSPLNCMPGAGWQPLEQGRITVPVTDTLDTLGTAPRPIEINRVVIGKGLDKQLVLYWYQSHRRVVASEYWGKIYTVLDAVKYNRTDAALVRVVAPISDSVPVDLAEKQGLSFIQSLFPRLNKSLPS